MSGVAAPVIATGARWNDTAALAAAWGGGEQLERVFGALRGCLADDALPPLPADVLALVKDVTWGQVAETMRIADSSQWRDNLTVSRSAMSHQLLWLLFGGDSPSPRKLQGGYHKAVSRALSAQIEKPFEADADAEARRAKKAGGKDGKYLLSAARATVASRAPWSTPADVPMLRRLMTDPLDAAAALLASLRQSAAPVQVITLPL